MLRITIFLLFKVIQRIETEAAFIRRYLEFKSPKSKKKREKERKEREQAVNMKTRELVFMAVKNISTKIKIIILF